MTPSSASHQQQLLNNTNNNSNNNNYKKQRLEADLATVESLIARISNLEGRALSEHGEGEGEGEDGNPGSAQGWDEGSGEGGDSGRQSSSGGGQGLEEAGKDAFTKERSAVGARMTVASSSSDIRAGHKRETDAGGLNLASSKKPKLFGDGTLGTGEEGEQLSAKDHLSDGSRDQSLSRRVDNGSTLKDDLSTLHSGEEASSQHREAPAVEYPGGETFHEAWERSAQILAGLKTSYKDAWVFCQPVQVLWPELLDYSKVIVRPMDLGTVQKRMESKYYASPGEFAEDVRLTFKNAMQYNKKGSIYYNLAKALLVKFDKSFKSVERMLESRNSAKPAIRDVAEAAPLLRPEKVETPVIPQVKVEAPPPLQVTQEHKQQPPREHTVTPTERDRDVVRSKSNKIKGLNPRLGRLTSSQAYGGCRALSAKEKEKLSELIESFPPDRMTKVVDILNKNNPDLLEEKREELELDLDRLDQATQFDLFRLAMNWQKSKNKVQGRTKLTANAGEQEGVQKQVRMEDYESREVDIVGVDSPVHEKNKEKKGSADPEESSSDSGSSSESSSSGSTSSSGSSSDSESEADAGSEKG